MKRKPHPLWRGEPPKDKREKPLEMTPGKHNGVYVCTPVRIEGRK